MFQYRHVNRVHYPQKHVVVCEDDTANQARIARHFADVFDPQGNVQFSFVPGSLACAAIVQWCPKIDLIILDHDMPLGNGSDLIEWLKAHRRWIPAMTFSGIDENNKHMMRLGASYCFSKDQVIQGQADEVIRRVLA